MIGLRWGYVQVGMLWIYVTGCIEKNYVTPHFKTTYLDIKSIYREEDSPV